METAHQPTTYRAAKPVNVIAPRALREAEAAQYLGFSSSHIRNTRTSDLRARREGRPIKGPRWVTIGTAVRYLREDLDDWLERHRVNCGVVETA